MASMSAWGFALGRERSPLRMLALAVIVLVLVDPLLRLFGKDSQSFARIERVRALDRLAHDAVLAELIGKGVSADAAQAALDAAPQGARGK
jgi:hypothetical protein